VRFVLGGLTAVVARQRKKERGVAGQRRGTDAAALDASAGAALEPALVENGISRGEQTGGRFRKIPPLPDASFGCFYGPPRWPFHDHWRARLP
jgi:hypothetical protein